MEFANAKKNYKLTFLTLMELTPFSPYNRSLILNSRVANKAAQH